MRRTAALTLATLAAIAWSAAPPTPSRDIPNLTSHVKLANRYLAGLPKEDRHNVWFFTWQPLAAHDSRLIWQRVQSWWHNQMNTNTSTGYPRIVPGSDGLLWAIDLRDYRWNAAARRAVALREPYCRAPLCGITTEDAAVMHALIGEDGSGLPQGDTVPLIGMVRADWFFRTTIETQRDKVINNATSYYDLTFAHERFVLKKDDFPKNETEWRDFFGLDVIAKHQRGFKLNLARRGAIVAGRKDDPEKGSIVAQNNRVVEILSNVFGRVTMKTYDTDDTGKDYYIEDPITAAKGKAKARAGEHLGGVGNGAIIGMLTNGAGDRIEEATGDFVHTQVLTVRRCVDCHAQDGGLIPPKDLYTKLKADGIKFKFKNRDDANVVQSFFEEWRGEIKGWQQPYLDLIARTTRDPKTGESMKPAELVAEMNTYREWYDAPVTARTLAHDFSMPVVDVRVLLAKSARQTIDGKPIASGSFQIMAKGGSIPRRVYEARVYREFGLLLEADKNPEVIKPFRLPPIRRKAG